MKSIFHRFTVVREQVPGWTSGQDNRTQASQPGVHVQVLASNMEFLCQVYLVKWILCQKFKKFQEIQEEEGAAWPSISKNLTKVAYSFLKYTPIVANPHEHIPRCVIQQKKPETLYFHHVEGYHEPSTWAGVKGCVKMLLNFWTPCSIHSHTRGIKWVWWACVSLGKTFLKDLGAISKHDAGKGATIISTQTRRPK